MAALPLSPRRFACTRRAALAGLGATPAAALFGACRPATGEDEEPADPEWPAVDLGAVAANLEAVFDVILPAGRDADGAVVEPGAVEAGAYTVLQLDRLVPLARSQGLLPVLPDWLEENASVFDAAAQAIVSAELDRMAAERALLTPFRDLPRRDQEAAVADAFVDPDRRALMEFLRAVAVVAWLGAVVNDLGFRHAGLPAFDDFPDRLAVRGYPRTVDGVVEDYTDGVAPAPTDGDDLSGVLDARGDLR